MLFDVWGSDTLIHWAGWAIVFIGLIVLNEVGRRTKLGAAIIFGVAPLAMTIYCAATGKTIAEAEAEFADQGYGVFKPAVGEAVVELVRPIREKTEQLLADKAYLESIYKEGAERASYLANKTLRKVYKKVGFVAR